MTRAGRCSILAIFPFSLKGFDLKSILPESQENESEKKEFENHVKFIEGKFWRETSLEF